MILVKYWFLDWVLILACLIGAECLGTCFNDLCRIILCSTWSCLFLCTGPFAINFDEPYIWLHFPPSRLFLLPALVLRCCFVSPLVSLVTFVVLFRHSKLSPSELGCKNIYIYIFMIISFINSYFVRIKS